MLKSSVITATDVYPTGSTFLEALPPPTPAAPTVSISITRLPYGKTSASPNRIPFTIPSSQPLEHFLVALDSDYLINIVSGNHSYRLLYQTVEMSVAVPSTLEDSAAEIFCTSREYVGDGGEQAIGEGLRAGEVGGEEVEGGLGTPPQGKEVTRVLDTPHGKEFLDQKSRRDETLQSVYDLMEPGVPEYIDPESLPTARRLFTVRAKATEQERNEIVLATDDEEENLVATVPVDLSLLSKSTSTTTSAPISFIGTLPPSSGGLNNEHSPRDIFPEFLVADPTPPGDRKSREPSMDKKDESGNSTASADIPDSLPEAFHAVKEVERLRYAPPGVKTYIHRKTKGIVGERALTTDEEGEDEKIGKKDRMQQRRELSSIPQTRNEAHSEEDVTEVQGSSQLEPGPIEIPKEETGKMNVDEKGGGVSEANSPTIISQRPRLKRVRKEVTVEITSYNGNMQGICDFDGIEAVDHEEDEGIVVDNAKSGIGKKVNMGSKEYRKPPRKRARKEENIKEGLDEATTHDKGNNTQYTFHGSSDEAEAEPSLPPPLKTPKTPKTPKTYVRAPAKRGKKPTGTANSTTSPATPSAGASSTSPRTSKQYEGPPPKIVFSNSSFPERKDAASILRSLGVKKAHKATDKDVTHLVVGNGGLVRSR